jgi:dihydrofolate reductase
MRKIIVYIATSADGYIARADGDVEWLDRPAAPGNYGMNEFYKSIDTILWGRKTAIRAEGGYFDEKIKNYVFSRHPPKANPPGAEFVKEPISEFANRIRQMPGKNIWMMGGAGIIGSFLDANQIDEFIIHMMPTFIGEGIPLVQPRHRSVSLNLLSCKAFSDGVVRLHYSVRKVAGKDS